MTRRLSKDFPRRQSRGLPQKHTILIVGEGQETEPNYFDGLSRVQCVRNRYAVTVKKGNGRSRVQIMQEAINKKGRGKQYDETWCVFDTESLDSDDAVNDYNAAIALANKNGIEVAVSNPSFEVWLLAHFTRSSRHFSNGDAVIVELNKHWRPAFKCEYNKSDVDIFGKLFSRMEAAIDTAKTVLKKDHAGRTDIAKCNSATNVYRLVDKLLKGDEKASQAVKKKD